MTWGEMLKISISTTVFVEGGGLAVLPEMRLQPTGTIYFEGDFGGWADRNSPVRPRCAREMRIRLTVVFHASPRHGCTSFCMARLHNCN